MEDTSTDVMEDNSAGNNGADSAGKDDDDDVEPPVMSSNPVCLWTERGVFKCVCEGVWGCVCVCVYLFCLTDLLLWMFYSE